jgi:putative colanic acid biosynthesis glycosyltransferase
MNGILLSIISITRNDAAGIQRTLLSLKPLLADSGASVEVIVVDGSDGGSESLATLRGFEQENVTLLRQKGRGLYQAMNEGLKASKGQFAWFLNGGDESSAQWNELFERLSRATADVFLFDYFYRSPTSMTLRRSRSEKYLWHALPTSHQAMIFSRKNPFGEITYPQELQISADYAFAAHYKVNGARFAVVHSPIAVFDGQGVSLLRSREIAVDARAVQRQILSVALPLRIASAILHRASRLARRVRQLGKQQSDPS